MNAPSVGFAVAPFTPAIGGLVTGVDLARPLSDTVVAKLKSAVAERHVLFFEGQTRIRTSIGGSPRASANCTSIRSTRTSTTFQRSL
jgi:alpha-ketoglutarate-dependent taurine dioxygenase